MLAAGEQDPGTLHEVACGQKQPCPPDDATTLKRLANIQALLRNAAAWVPA
jgi:hypothetical protein